MSRYKAYSEYKETRHSWLENVPAHWKMLPLKFLTEHHVTDGPHETPEFIDEGVPFLSVDGIQNNQLVFEGCRYISREDHSRYSIKCKPNQGDVLLGKAASVGKVAHVDTNIEFNVWSPLALIRPRSKKTGRFIYYSLQSALLQMQCDMYSNANTQKNLGMSTIDNLAFACPTDDEAEQVANFLDHETAKIDALIEKQQRLIELLKEKRQAVISHAVTKGLNPNVPMKDSGVEWLGEVPAHWALLRVKFVCSFTTSGPRGWSEQVGETGSLFIQSGDLSDILSVNFSGSKRVQIGNDAEAKRTALRNGDVVVCITGAKTGNVGLCDVVPEDAYINQHLCLIRPTSIIASAFLAVQLKSSLGQTYFELSQYGLKQGLSLENVREAPVLVPPVTEQSAIVSYLNVEAEKFDVLSAKAQHSKELLQERRTALISAAVTGKIDVRGWQPAAAQEAAGVEC
jgi:type I restriction enzyme S subunit